MFLELTNLIISQFKSISVIYESKGSIFFFFSWLMTEFLARNFHDNHAASVKIVWANLISNIPSENLPKLKKQNSFNRLLLIKMTLF